MVQNIEELSAKLQGEPLANRRVFVDREIPLFVSRTAQNVPPQISVMTRPRRAIARQAADRTWRQRRQHSAGHGKRTKLQKVGRIAFVVNDRPDHIRPVESVPAPAEVVFKVVVEGEWLAAL